MPVAVKVDDSAIDDLNTVIGEIELLGRRKPAELVRKATGDAILGASSRNAEKTGGSSYKGLFGQLADTAPREGEITDAAEGRGWRVARSSESTRLAEQRADKILGGDKSGVFQLMHGSGGRVLTPRRIFMRTRGKQKGQYGFATGRRKAPKTAKYAGAVYKRGQGGRFVSGARAYYRDRGWTQLNRSALVALLTVNVRENARRSVAAQFLPKRYRTMLIRKSQLEYKRGQAKGMSSVDAAMAHEHRRELVTNRSGTRMGEIDMNLRADRATSVITAFRGIPSRYQGHATRAIRAVADDRLGYLKRATQKEIRGILARH